MRFYYRIRNDEGEEIIGELEAPSRLEALRRLAAGGWRVDYCDTRPIPAQPPRRADIPAGQPSATPQPSVKPRVFVSLYVFRPSPAHLSTFYHQLGELLGAGVSPYEAVLQLAGNAPTAHLRLAMAEIAPALAAGGSLAENLARFPQLFPPEAVGLLRAAERSGQWQVICDDLKRWYTDAYRGGLWFVVARFYYAVLIVLAILVPYFPYIVSRGARWYLSLLLTRLLPIVFALFVAWLVLRILAASLSTRRLRETLAASVPLANRVARAVAAARFLRALGSLLSAGLQPAEALELAAAATGNHVFERQVLAAASAIRGGVPIDQAFDALSFLDARQRAVLATAFAAGRLDEGLAHLAAMSSEAAASSARLARFFSQGALFAAVSIIGGIAFILAVLNFYRALAEAAGATDLWEELLH